MLNPISKITETLQISSQEAEIIIEKAKAGKEITDSFTLDEWLETRFLPNCVLISEEGYTKMCVDALKILNSTASTDYGSTRQRDLGQSWSDMTRGYLGEYAFQEFMKQKWNLETTLNHEQGLLQDFLPTDIHLVKEQGGDYRSPKLTIGIKTSKWNGIWLDIPGDQFNHSQVHVFVKAGTGRDHLFAFFKTLSVFKDKILKRGEEIGALTTDESRDLFDNLPSFTPIPAYICGFISSNQEYPDLSYSGKKGKKHFTIESWRGPILPGDLDRIKEIEKISGEVKFLGIGKFSHDKGYLFNSGSLQWKVDDWEKIKNNL